MAYEHKDLRREIFNDILNMSPKEEVLVDLKHKDSIRRLLSLEVPETFPGRDYRTWKTKDNQHIVIYRYL